MTKLYLTKKKDRSPVYSTSKRSLQLTKLTLTQILIFIYKLHFE